MSGEANSTICCTVCEEIVQPEGECQRVYMTHERTMQCPRARRRSLEGSAELIAESGIEGFLPLPKGRYAINMRTAAVGDHLAADLSCIFPESELEGLGADSLDSVAIVGDLEVEFGIKIPDTDLPGLKTVGDLVACVVRNGAKL